ncbi:MAG: haloacid dehalogenase-like hydrolase [Bacteroidales bacterium]|nr:haloacid dehalogenase-like hydrolase [Bacteroidales bacterium]
MKTIQFYLAISILTFALLSSCTQEKPQVDPLPSWNETPIKKSILEYINKAVKEIPAENRIAVFDMDGTIACETPLWFEMYAAVNGLNQQSAKDPKLFKYPEYQYAKKLEKNPADPSVLNSWTNFTVKPYYNYIDSMVWKAYVGIDNEAYVDSARIYLSKTKDQKFNMPLVNMFYQPMLELLKHLKENQFTIYVVSGSVQGVIWSVCPQVIGFDRAHLIGTTQILVPSYKPIEKKTQFMIAKGIFPPKDDKDGKSLNIYSHIGKVPVFAFGNTTGDFGMFRLASTSKYPHAEYLLNHNDSIREYAYPPYHGPTDTTWQRTMRLNGWKQVDMAQEFKTVWMTK